MVVKYYFDLMSQPSRAIYIFLKANKINFVPKPIALRKGEHFTDEFKKLNPWQKVPVLDDDGFVLTEREMERELGTRMTEHLRDVRLKKDRPINAHFGLLGHTEKDVAFGVLQKIVAILRYLTSKFKLPEHWYPKNDLYKQARIEEYLHWQHLNTRMQCAMVFQQKLIMPVARQGKIDEKKVQRFKNEIPKVINHLDKYFLGDNKFIAGDEISVADLLGVCELMQLYPVFEEELYMSNDKVKAWMERVRQTLNPHFDEGSAIVYRTRKAYEKLGPTLGAKL